MDDLRRYELWNVAVANAVYPELAEAAPVYMDLEGPILAKIAREAGYGGTPREGLREAVRQVTVSRGSFSLSRLWHAQRRWRTAKGPVIPPPTLAFLALTALAAEDMGGSADGFTGRNYYSRLCVLLGVDPKHVPVRQQYQKYAEALWGDLNRWLEGLDGLRGTPTAYALTYRFVGLPLSQALVREGDRRKLPMFFAQYGLAAGMELAPEVLERYLGAWLTSDGCQASVALKGLWSKPSARERIATVAALELMGWDGAISANQASEAPALKRVGLVARVHQGFFGSGVDIALTMRTFGIDSFDGRMEVEAAHGGWVPLTMTPTIAHVWQTSFNSGLDMASVLEGVVKLRLEAAEDIYRHHPRTIVPLVFDEMQSGFIEQERLQLNVESMILAREQAKGKPIASLVVEVLQSCARPGFRVEADIAGLASGWVLISGVQLFGAPSISRFNELIPLARDQLTVAGGMRIPSRVRKWSVLAPPEIRASVESADSLRLVLANLKTDGAQEWSTTGGALIVSLEELSLPVGDYRAVLFAGESTDPLQQVTIRLRSADGVDAAWNLAPRLRYQLDGPGAAVGALTASEGAPDETADAFVDGAVTVRGVDREATVRATSSPVWSAPRPSPESIAPVRIGSPDAQSCVVTGAHYLEFPTFRGGWQPKFIEGVCKYCGLVKRSPSWPRRRGHGSGASAATSIQVSNLPPVQGSASRLWDAALDALMHLGGGAATALTGVAAQIDGGALFASAFPVRLEALGHLAVEREPDGTPKRWEISPSCLVSVPQGLELLGFWPDHLVDAAMAVLGPVGGILVNVPEEGRPSHRRIEGVDSHRASHLLGEEISVSTAPTLNMLMALPPLSTVSEALPREPMPGFLRAERFDITTAAWAATNDTSEPGAYRLTRGFERMHLFRSSEDVEAGLAARGSVYLVKHLAANLARTCLTIYFPRQNAVVAPRGCDLPGLYARAAVLASGELPGTGSVTLGEMKRKCLVYRGISREQADLLVTLLSR